MVLKRDIFKDERVLIAEDDAVSRQVIASHLESWGLKVEAYDDGASAMMALRKVDAPRMAIIDWEMPEMDGIEICTRLREVGRITYVIILTSRNAKDDLIQALDSGADDFLVKPCDPDELKARLKAGLRINHLHEELEKQIRELHLANERLERLREGKGGGYI